jgi:hypothetical protein
VDGLVFEADVLERLARLGDPLAGTSARARPLPRAR